MSSTIVRGRGQLTIPSDIRKAAHLEEGDPVEVEIVEEGILLRPRKVIDATQAWSSQCRPIRGFRDSARTLLR